MTPAAATASTSPAGAWRGLKLGLWQRDINVRWCIQRNYTPYEGDGAFLAPATERTKRLWKRLEALFVEERKRGVLRAIYNDAGNSVRATKAIEYIADQLRANVFGSGKSGSTADTGDRAAAAAS
jgi:pyruvate-formate lyase